MPIIMSLTDLYKKILRLPEEIRKYIGIVYFEKDYSGLTWDVTHGLNTTSVSVSILNSANKIIYPKDIIVLDENTVSVVFSKPVSGICRVTGKATYE